jgi:hypothetical protein
MFVRFCLLRLTPSPEPLLDEGKKKDDRDRGDRIEQKDSEHRTYPAGATDGEHAAMELALALSLRG